MSQYSRRTFLATTSLALTGTALHSSRVSASRALTWRSALTLSRTVGLSASCAEDYLPTPIAPETLQALATQAVDAVKGAGATYADIRVAERYVMKYVLGLDAFEPTVFLDPTFGYGIRVVVDGAWAFTHGSQYSGDAIVASAHDAVAMAKTYARVTRHRAELAPVPVVTGEWRTPIKEDPFTVPLYDQAALLGAYRQAMGRVAHCGIPLEYPPTFRWIRERRVFASSEGSLVTQQLHRAQPSVGVSANYLFGDVVLTIPELTVARSGGFELVSDPALQERVKARAEMTARLAQLPRTMLDVGRYPLVVDGTTCGMMLGRTLGVALELDRALGYEADASGTSYLSPPAALIGTPVAHSSMTVTATRAVPTVMAVKWDDEGVESQEYPVITNGQLVNYHASRQTAPALGTAGVHGPSRPSQGCLVAPDADQMPLLRPPHLTLSASAPPASLDELCQGIKHGLLLVDRHGLTSDQQLTSANITFDRYGDSSRDGILLEIKNGQPVRRVMGNGLQFNTRTLWQKKLIALGDLSTVHESQFEIEKGVPNVPAAQSASAPAALFSEVDVIATEPIV